jgi:hypothetical protein
MIITHFLRGATIQMNINPEFMTVVDEFVLAIEDTARAEERFRVAKEALRDAMTRHEVKKLWHRGVAVDRSGYSVEFRRMKTAAEVAAEISAAGDTKSGD